METLTEEERAEIVEQRDQALVRARQNFLVLDVNGDGIVDVEEREEAQKMTWDLLGPQTASREEFYERKDRINAFFKQADEQNGGRIYMEAWLEFYAQMFDYAIER